MEFVVSIVSSILMFVAGFWGMIALIKMVKILLSMRNYDELEKHIVSETFVISFCVIIFFHMIQLILSFTKFDLSYLISAGGFYKGGIVSNSPLHIDSFLFDMGILGLVYQIRKRKYGMK